MERERFRVRKGDLRSISLASALVSGKPLLSIELRVGYEEVVLGACLAWRPGAITFVSLRTNRIFFSEGVLLLLR